MVILIVCRRHWWSVAITPHECLRSHHEPWLANCKAADAVDRSSSNEWLYTRSVIHRTCEWDFHGQVLGNKNKNMDILLSFGRPCSGTLRDATPPLARMKATTASRLEIENCGKDMDA
jgi:hypothetical protein